MSKPIDYLNWVYVMVESARNNVDKARKSRREWVEKILDGIRSYRPQDNKDIKKETKWLTDALKDESTWELVGFATNLQYLRVDHDDDEILKYVFVHPWGTPPLIYKHKKLPMFITVGPGIRWNDSILRELTENGYKDNIEGATG